MPAPWEAYQSSAGPWSKYQVAPSAADIPGAVPQPKYQEPSMADRLLGIPEAALSTITGAVAMPIGAIAGILGGKLGEGPNVKAMESVMEAGTYVPRTESGQQYLRSLGQLTSGIPALYLPLVKQDRLPKQPTRLPLALLQQHNAPFKRSKTLWYGRQSHRWAVGAQR